MPLFQDVPPLFPIRLQQSFPIDLTLVTTALAEVESFSLCESADGFARAKSDTIGSEFARHTLRALLAVEA